MQTPNRSFTVGDWHIDGDALTARKGGEERPLEPRAYQVLQYLAERPGELITIDELMDALWTGTVVTPNAVTRVLGNIRKVLDDNAKQPIYIQTVARTGYRLIATVTHPTAGPGRLSGKSIAAIALVIVAVIVGVWLFVPARTSDASVAVLPLQNLTGDASLEYIADGVAEEIINGLAGTPNLEVIGRNRSFQIRGDEAQLRKSAQSLDVGYFVIGSVRKNGQQLRMSAQLVAAANGSTISSVTVDNYLLDLFDGQEQISSGIRAALADELDLADAPISPGKRRAPNPEAYDLFLRARHVWHRRGTEPLQPAIDYLSEAVRVDAEFARGWAALANAYLTYPSYSPRGYATWHLAEDAAKKAIDLDPDMGASYSVLATFALARHEWSNANALYLEGIRRAPQDATTHYWYSEFLAATGQRSASVRELMAALEIDPTYQPPQVNLAFEFLTFGDIENGSERFASIWNTGFQDSAGWLGNFISSILRQDYESATHWINQARFGPAGTDILRRYVAAESGSPADPELVADVTSIDNPVFHHSLAIWMGARLQAYDEVFALINHRLDQERSLELRVLWGAGIDLQQQPQFAQLAERLGLIDFWQRNGWNDHCLEEDSQLVCDNRNLTPEKLAILLSPKD